MKVFAVLFAFLFFIQINSCSNQQEGNQTRELPSDRKITESITSQLKAVSDVPAENLSVETKEGIVALSGSTTNLLAKQKAEKIAQSVYGVLAVVNNLKISMTRPDTAIEDDINRALSTDPATENWEISAEVNNGVVTLKGIADSWQQRQLVGTIASGVKGVKDINNNILVEYATDRSDEEIKTEVKKAITFDSRIRGKMVDVRVQNSKVNISGAVSSAYEKSLLAEIAHVRGVESVNVDRLEVHPEYESSMFQELPVASLTDAEVKNAIERALKYDPRVPEGNITVAVEGNVATLEGSVLNLNSKLAAGSDAKNTAGVNTVQNDIKVERKVVVKPEIPTSDEAISQRIREAIIRDPYVDNAHIEINVDDGFVELKGNVRTNFEKDRIRKVASNVKGVIAIDNELKVEPSAQNT